MYFIKDKYNIYNSVEMIETYEIELLYWLESKVLGSLVEVVNIAILFKIHFTRMLGSLRHGALFVVYVEHFQCIEYKCCIIIVGICLDEIEMRSAITLIIFIFYFGVWGVDIYMYFVYSCNTCTFGSYIYPCLISCTVDVIHTECENILILLYSRVEFYFCSFEKHHFYIGYSNYYIVG
jgi:hypothetical protein